LRAALVTPLSGPLAVFGRAGAAALELWSREASVPLDVVDAHPDPAAAMTAAAVGRPTMLFGPYGSSPAVAAIGAVAATDGPAVWNQGGATSRLAWPGFPRVLNVLAPASTYFHGSLHAVLATGASAASVTVLHADTGFARDVASGAIAVGTELGYEVSQVVFAPGDAARAARTAPPADVVLVAASFEDELVAARTLLVERARAPQVLGLVGAGVEDVLSELGDRRERLVGPAQWTVRSAVGAPVDEGPDAGWFVDAYRRATGREPEYPAAQAFAAGVLASRCLRDAGSVDPADVVVAAVRLRCRTCYGDFRLDPETGGQIGHRVLTVQWQGGVQRVVWPPEHAEAPLLVASGQEWAG
jgi:ABC-type branched-subunit amino acid transport system substrate-binding protein